jgi:hypothetical protein
VKPWLTLPPDFDKPELFSGYPLSRRRTKFTAFKLITTSRF